MQKIAIHWFRRDLRISDNPALLAAAGNATMVLPVYVLSEWEANHPWTGSNRQSFLCHSLASLARNLDSIGSRLIFRQGDPVEEVLTLARTTGATTLTFNRAIDPSSRRIEQRMMDQGKKQGLEVLNFQDLCLHERDEVVTAKGEPFRVFTPYSKAWRKLPKAKAQPPPVSLTTPKEIHSLPCPTPAHWKLEQAGNILQGGERAARERLEEFLKKRLPGYADLRDFPAQEATSRLSQDLRFGLISPRQIYAKIQKVPETSATLPQTAADKFLSELIWREFYFQILWHFPEVLEHEFNPSFRGLPWNRDEKVYQRWCNGETGFPIVDAGMRELRTTGFMHNRVRMITAMFLTKDLHLDWRMGEQWFMQQLVDGEIASNNGGWQWSAGTGADAAPYFRIQNPWTQTKRYDPNGEYIKRWVPELRSTSAARLCQPPAEGESLASGYPPPMVDHSAERQKTLEIFKNFRPMSS
jgi:deoxyribodipyrimidine photo-lyase